MNVLALEPYYGGSHKAMLDGWSARSEHRWTVLGLPARDWKWRMRHAAVTFADMVRSRHALGESFDLLFTSDMLNLAEFRGLAPEPIRRLPTVVYFHENQLTYPSRGEDARDLHFAFSNMTSALAADQAWFNSAFHRDSFLEALTQLLCRMPPEKLADVPQRIRAKSIVEPPGVDGVDRPAQREPGPLRILWAARWEHDKNPVEFFEAIQRLSARGVPFRLSVVGQQFRETPPIFAEARRSLREHIDHWGYQATRDKYQAVLLRADVVVSTAEHEFFGISMVEAMAAGAAPILPRRLSYPELLAPLDEADKEAFLYDGTAADLADRLETSARRLEEGRLWNGDPARVAQAMERFAWDRRAREMDYRLEVVLRTGS